MAAGKEEEMFVTGQFKCNEYILCKAPHSQKNESIMFVHVLGQLRELCLRMHEGCGSWQVGGSELCMPLRLAVSACNIRK